MPIIVGPTILGTIAVVNDPAAIRRVFVDNAANYRKDALQKRVLGQGLSDGLLEVEGDDWRVQRRTLAPLFTPKTVSSFAHAINAAAEDLVARWVRLREGRMIDIQPEMARVTLDVLGRTIFSDGLGQDFDQFVAAIVWLFRNRWPARSSSIFLIFPTGCHAGAKLGNRSAENFFASVVETIIAKRKRLLARTRSRAPRYPHPPPRSSGSANRRRAERCGSQSQHPDLYRGRARDHRQRLDLVFVSSFAL